MENQPKAPVIATLLVRGNALAMFVVGAMRVFDLIYVLCDPVYTVRMEAPGALRYAVASIAFAWGTSLLLIMLSRWIGRLFLLDLEGSEI